MVQLFAGDAYERSYLGAETRIVITTLNMALTSAGEAAGLASGGILLIVASLAAVIGLIVKATESQKDNTDALVKSAQADADALKGTNDKIKALTDYSKVVGKLPPVLQSFLQAEQRLAQDQQVALTSAVNAASEALKNQIAEMVKANQTSNMLASVWEGLKEGTENLLKGFINIASYVTAGIIPSFEKWVSVGHELTSMFSSASNGAYISQQQFAALKIKTDENVASQKELAFEAQHAGMTISEWSKKMSDDHKEALEKMKAADNAYWSNVSKAEQIEQQINIKLQADITKDHQSQLDARQAAEDKFNKKIVQDVDTVSKDFGNAMAQMLVDGKSFTDEMSTMFTEMANQIISKILQMIDEWAIFSAMTGMGGGIGLAGAAGLKSIGFGAAVGGEMMVDRPTMFMAGEGGPELASFTPMSGSSSFGQAARSAGGGDTYNVNVTIPVSGVNDPNQIAQKVGQILAQQIRGGGQISLSRV